MPWQLVPWRLKVPTDSSFPQISGGDFEDKQLLVEHHLCHILACSSTSVYPRLNLIDYELRNMATSSAIPVRAPIDRDRIPYTDRRQPISYTRLKQIANDVRFN